MANKDFVVKNSLIVGDTATINGVQIDPSGASSNQVLKFDGTKFAPASEGDVSGTVYNSTIGDGTNSSYTITHGFGTRNVVVVIRNAASPYEVINARWEATTINSITVDFSSPVTSNSIIVSVYSTVSGTSINALDDIADVTAPSPSSGDLLKWNGTAWVNASGYALLASPTFTGTPTLPTGTIATTQSAADSTTKVATTAFVTTADDLKANLASPTFTGTVSGISKTMVGLGNVDNTSNSTERAASATLTNKTLTSPVINTPSGIVKGDVGLGLVDNTADTAKPVSTAQQTVLDLKANIASPTFTGTVTIPSGASISGFALLASPALTGTPTAPTAANGTNTTQVATTAFVADAVSTATAANTVELGADTTGSYVASLVAGTGVTLTNNSGETATPTIAIGQAVGTGSNVTFNNLTVSGDLTVSGTTTSINTETLTIDDNIVVLNNNATGSPTQNAGLEIERGSSTNVALRWNETDDKWQFTNDGSVYTDLGSSGAVISASAPNSPTAGQLWFDEDTAQTFVYYDSSWIEIGASGMAATISDTAPSSPIAGQVWFNSSSGATFIYYGGVWVEVGVAPFDQLLSTLDAKGDLLVGTADNTVTKLAVGSASQVLTVDSTTATGLKWSTPTVYQAVVANVSDTEIGYLDGVTSAIQTQLSNKQAVVANVSDTEIGYLDGVTSAIQTQLGTKASTGKAIAMSIVFSG